MVDVLEVTLIKSLNILEHSLCRLQGSYCLCLMDLMSLLGLFQGGTINIMSR